MSEPPAAAHYLVDVESGGVLLANMLTGWLDANGESSLSVEAVEYATYETYPLGHPAISSDSTRLTEAPVDSRRGFCVPRKV